MSQVPPPMTVPPVGYQTPGPNKPNTLAVMALVLGIGSFFLCFVPIYAGPVGLGLLGAIGAIILGYMARQKIARGEQSGGGMATAGMVLGIVNIILQIVLILIALIFGAALLGFGNRMIQEAERQQQIEQQQQTDGVESTDAPPATQP